jgi:hypothetical protein
VQLPIDMLTRGQEWSPEVKAHARYRIWWCGTEYGIVASWLVLEHCPAFEACYSYARRGVGDVEHVM